MNSSRIDEIINNYFKNEGFDLSAKIGADFSYLYLSDKITYSLVVSERMDRLFLDYAKRKGLSIDCGIFLLSLFHEVGHYETIDELEDDEVEYCMAVKETLGHSDADCETYFNLIDESLATIWAISYINNNVEKIRQFAEDLQKEIKNFYEKYQIED